MLYFKTTIIRVIAIVKFVISQKLQNTFNTCPRGFDLMYSNAWRSWRKTETCRIQC